MIYTVKGYTGQYADFTDTIELSDSFDFAALGVWHDPRYVAAYSELKRALLDSECPSDYLEVLDYNALEQRDDLADFDGQVVLLAEALGCDNCSSGGDNEWTGGCDDSPHGGFMLVFEVCDG